MKLFDKILRSVSKPDDLLKAAKPFAMTMRHARLLISKQATNESHSVVKPSNMGRSLFYWALQSAPPITLSTPRLLFIEILEKPFSQGVDVCVPSAAAFECWETAVLSDQATNMPTRHTYVRS